MVKPMKEIYLTLARMYVRFINTSFIFYSIWHWNVFILKETKIDIKILAITFISRENFAQSLNIFGIEQRNSAGKHKI